MSIHMCRTAAFFGVILSLLLPGLFSNAAEPRGDKGQSAGPAAKSQGDKLMTIQITSTAFKEGEAIPKKYTGEGTTCRRPWPGPAYLKMPRNWC